MARRLCVGLSGCGVSSNTVGSIHDLEKCKTCRALRQELCTSAKKRVMGFRKLFYPLKLPLLSFLSGGTWLCITFFSRILMSSE